MEVLKLQKENIKGLIIDLVDNGGVHGRGDKIQ
jgi:C-terminal processing protease CtpA/Prc